MLPHRQIAGTARLVSAIKRTGCDLVYTNSVAAGAAAMAAKIAGKPHVWHLREFGQDDYELAYDLGRTLSDFLMRKLSITFIANSTAVANAYRERLGQAPINVIYNAVELIESPESRLAAEADAQWRQQGAIRCILVGKILQGKGQVDAVWAVLHLLHMKIPTELLIVGGTLDRSYLKRIKGLIKDHNLTDRVRILGHTDNPIALMNSADLVLVCSRREAFGRVTVEGMKLGKPVIGTRTGGTTEIIDEGRTGLLYEPGDAQDLARKIAYLHDHKIHRDQMGLAAHACAHARFNLEDYGTNIAAVIHQIVGGQKESALISKTSEMTRHASAAHKVREGNELGGAYRSEQRAA